MNVIATIEPGAIAASRRSVVAVAALVMYIDTPLDDTSASRRLVEPGVEEGLPPVVVGLEVDRDQAEVLRHAVAELLQALPLPRLWPGLVDLEHPDTTGELRVSLDERVEAGAEQDVLADALLDEQVFDEPGARDDRGAVRACADRVHVRTVAPPLLRVGEGEADLVVDQVGRVVELHVQGAPQRGAHRAAVRFDFVHCLSLPGGALSSLSLIEAGCSVVRPVIRCFSRT